MQRYGDNDVRVGVGLTFPFGGTRRDSSVTPRIELTIQQERIENRPHSIPTNVDPRNKVLLNGRQETRIGLSLEQKPSVLLNGRILQPVENRSNIGAAGIVVIGIAAVGLGIVVFNELAEDSFEAIVEGGTGRN